MMIPNFAARIDDGNDMDDWNTTDYRTGDSRPLRADRWFQDNPECAPSLSSSDFSGIRINIWNRAKVRRLLTHSLAGGGSHNLGYGALRHEMISHGNAGEFGKYAILSVLPDKIARFLYEYHHTAYASLQLPPIPLDSSRIDVHGSLLRHQVPNFCFTYILCIWCIFKLNP
jgi:hypothetical protein